MKQVKETKNRKVLSEGRDNGMGFAFLNRVSKDEFETVQPLSPCKDYLNEVVVTEASGIPTKGCGLVYPKKLGIFKYRAYLAIKIVPTKNGHYSISPNIDDDFKKLNTNYKNIQKLLQTIESKLDFKIKTIINRANDGYFVVKFSKKWCRSTFSISLYSLLLRAGMQYDGTIDPMDFLKSFGMGQDGIMIKSILPKLDLIIERKELPPNRIAYSKTRLSNGMQSPHHSGIMTFDSKFEEVKFVE